MGKSDPPSPPDPQDTIAAQSQANMTGALANNAMSMVNQVTPYGSLTYSQSGQKFIPGDTGQTYWQGPNGQIQSSAPMQTTQATQQGSGGQWVNQGSDDRVWEPGQGGSTTSSQSTPMDGWSKVQGTYVPQYTATTELSPDQQKMLDYQNQAGINFSQTAANQSGQIRDTLSNPFQLSGNVPTSPEYEMANYRPEIADSFETGGDITRTYGTDFSQDRQRVEDALFSRLDTSLDRDRESMATRLANQGIRVGSEAYTRAMGDFGQNVNDARTSAILGAGQEQTRLAQLEAQRAQFENAAQQQGFGQNATQAAFGNDARQQDYANRMGNMQQRNSVLGQGFADDMTSRQQSVSEAFAQRNQPINEITALLSGSQVQNPQFVNTPVSRMPTTDAAGIIQNAYQQQMQGWQQQQAQQGGMLGGLMQLGGTLGAGAIMGPGAIGLGL